MVVSFCSMRPGQGRPAAAGVGQDVGNAPQAGSRWQPANCGQPQICYLSGGRPGLGWAWPVTMLGLVLVVGCGQRDEITRYTVPKLVPIEVAGAPKPPGGGMMPAAAPASGPQATLGAIVPLDEVGWFFKLTGPPEAVLQQREAFGAFIRSLRFSAGPDSKPSWDLPAGWEQQPGEGLRYATLRVGNHEPPLELTVIPLPRTSTETKKYILDNVNRWRNQVGLGPIAASDLSAQTQTLTVDGRPVTTVLLVGPGAAASEGGLASGSAKAADAPSGASTGSRAGSVSGEGPLTYEAPAHWQPAPPSPFSVLAFRVAEGGRTLEITVSTAGGDLLANVNRWRGQVGLAPWTAPELAAAVKKIRTLGTEGDYVQLVGPSSQGGGQTILGVVARAAGQTWFVKLRGDSTLAEREKPQFEAFVNSLKTR